MVTRDCQLVPTEDGEPSWLDTRGWDDTEGAEDSVSFRDVLAFINDTGLNKVRAIIWAIQPSERATGTLRRQAAFIDEFANGQIWGKVVIVCKQPSGGDLDRACRGALQAARDHSETDCSGARILRITRWTSYKKIFLPVGNISGGCILYQSTVRISQ